ncbi:VanZ family protein [Peribacillus butanolivorans]|uniref:VanZ family protein n=1 Tax=Peribacillus butanolivorans TaxID=421767 RepID=UPI0036CA6364
MTKIISWAAVIIWMSLIFYFSQQQATASNELSTGITEVIIQTVEKIAPDMGVDLRGLNHIVRKNAHFLIYLVLGVLVINALRRSGVHEYYRSMVLSILICALYAISDEVHQLFVNGRGPQVKDVFIDSAGAIVGISLFCMIDWILNNKNTH